MTFIKSKNRHFPVIGGKNRPGLWGVFLVLLALASWALQPDSLVKDSAISKDSLPKTDTSLSHIPVHSPKAAVINLEGTVDLGMAAFVGRSISAAEEQGADILIFVINTFGGRLDAAFAIVDTLTAVKGMRTVSLVSQKAISAGALISMACQELYMLPSTTIGDVAPVIQSQEGPLVLGEKVQSPLRAKFRNLAQRNGYPELLSEAMVTAELEVLQFKTGDTVLYMLSQEYEVLSAEEKERLGPRRTVVRAGELLTMTDTEALEFGFSRGTVENIDELKKILGVENSFDIAIDWAESLARFLGMLAPFLLLIGFGALYMEFQTPGFGVFGMIGIAALLLVFGGQYVSGLAGKLPLILLIFGIALMMVEIVLLPGTWITGLIGLSLMIAAMVLSLKEAPLPLLPRPPEATDSADLLATLAYVLGIALVALTFPVLSARFILPRMPKQMSLVLKEDMADAHSPHETSHDDVLPGCVGIARTNLRPVGRARFAEKEMDVQARDELIEASTPVRVISIQGNTVWVVRHRENK